MASERLDLVVFGATGFTGKYAVRHVARLCKEYGMKFGIAGRRKEALKDVLSELKTEDNTLDDVPLIVADVTDDKSLEKMTKQAKVILNCCGPYRFYGEPVVKACIATRTHHVDVSPELQYMERMELEYNKAAQEAGVYIVSACGVGSIPADLGVVFTQEKFGGDVNSVETYINLLPGSGGPFATLTSLETMMYMYVHKNELRELRSKLYPVGLPKFTPVLKSKGLLHCSDASRGWSIPSYICDRAVIRRTQRFFYEKYKKRPVQTEAYVTFESFLTFVAMAIITFMFFGIIRISVVRSLIKRYPYLLSFGMISHEKPKPESLERSHYSLTCKALGWTDKLAEPTDKHADPPNKKMVTRVSCVNPGYNGTAIMMILAAITILKEADKMPDNGGVLPPGAAFSKTSLIELLIKNGIKFEVVSSTEM